MSRLMRALFAVAFITLSAVGMSCDVNDYCLNCAVDGDAGTGDGGDGDGGDGGDNGDATDGGQCIPSGTEVCDNKDNDCDGATDEGQLPTIGDLCDNQMGECAGGVKTCAAGVVKCTKPPMGESCDNKDNDCDGVVDDGDPGGGAKCGTDMGECKAGTLTCQAGSIQCLGAIGGTMAPFGAPESCDGKDNNCDGMIDNGAPVSPTFCDNNDDAGLCNKGVPTCIGGATICVGLVGPSPELCDNLDQDCDSDTNTTNPNTNGFFLQTDPTNCGACGNVCNLMNAVEACTAGQCAIAACEANYHNNNGQTGDGCEFGPCTKNGNEVCNNADDDCDGLTDAADADMVTPPVATMCRTAGECAGATVVCDGAAGGFRCDYPDPDVQETNGVIQQETMCDGLDNDCDGAVDEGQPNLTQSCTRGQGECQTTGTFICDTANLTGPAVCNAPAPGVGATEVCDGKDNDCNGTIDDGALAGNLGGQEWVPLPIAGSSVEMMKYEASRPDATSTDGGTLTTHACSRPNAQPWTSLTYLQAVAVCNGMGARLCTETEWQSTCLPDVTYPVTANALTTNVDDFVFVEAENPLTNAPGSGASWARTSPASFNGITAMQVPDTGLAVLNSANALAQSPRLDYTVNLAGSTAYRVWMRMRSPAVVSTTPQLRDHTAAVAGLTATSSASTQVGDLVIVTTFSNGQNNIAAHNVNAAGGFVLINTFSIDDGSNDARLSIAYKVATAGGAQAYQGFTSTASTSLTGLTVLQAGTYDLGSIVSQTIAANSNNEPNPPSVGTVTGSTLVLAMAGWNLSSSQTSNAGAPSGFSEAWEFGGTGIADLSVATALGQGDPGSFSDGLNTSVDSTISATIAIGGGSISRTAWVGLTAGTSAGAANSTAVTTTADDQWQWVVSPALTSGSAGTHTFSIYMREDGVMIDTIAFSRQATNTPTFDNAWAYESNPRTAQPQVCNGDEVDTAPAVAIEASPTGATAAGTTATFNTTVPHRLAVGSSVTVAGVGVAAYNGTWTVVTTPTATRFTATITTSNPAASGGGTANGDQDDTLATGWSAACHAEHTTGDVFDMSGNVKEWTQARVFGQNPLRGGSSNNAVNGLTCKLNFTLADNEFFFPNVGFRCCRD